MSLKPMPIPPVPSETARVARAAFPKGNIYMKLRERIGTIIQDGIVNLMLTKCEMIQYRVLKKIMTAIYRGHVRL